MKSYSTNTPLVHQRGSDWSGKKDEWEEAVSKLTWQQDKSPWQPDKQHISDMTTGLHLTGRSVLRC